MEEGGRGLDLISLIFFLIFSLRSGTLFLLFTSLLSFLCMGLLLESLSSLIINYLPICLPRRLDTIELEATELLVLSYHSSIRFSPLALIPALPPPSLLP